MLGMVIGSASIVLTVTVGLTGRQYALDADPGHWPEHDRDAVRGGKCLRALRIPVHRTA